MTEVEQLSQNGIELTTEEDANNKARPADIEQDMREMERRKRVEAIMGSKLFREELERIVDSQIREGGSSGILQQLSDIVGIPTSRVGSVFKSSNCVLPINDIRGVESMGYSKGEKILRCKLGASFRLLDVYGWTNGLGAQITARLKVDQELFLVNPYGLLFHEVTASSLNKVDMQGNVVEQGTTNFGVNKNHFILHSVVHAARPDIRCAIYIGCSPVVAVSSLRVGLLPLTYDSVVIGEISSYQYTGFLSDAEDREKLVRNLGPVSKVILLTNYGALCCGETIEEAFFAAHHIVQACETQLKLLPIGVDNLVMIPEECRKTIYDAARRPPEDISALFEKKAAFAAASSEDASAADELQTENNKETSHKMLQQPKWRVGGAEFEALMRMLDNAGFRTGYIYRHPLIKSELPKPKNDVELPPAVSSLGYLLEEEELYRQGIWKKGDWRKGGDRSRWLNSPNVYQKVEVLETGTPDPKKITKWVADGSPTHSTPVRIEGALQFVPTGTNSKEFKKVQQQIKDNRRADKISAGPQSHILEGVTWDEANRIKDATVSSAGDHVVLMGAASKGIIQRGFQHNATVYKAPYAKNPFDNVTDDELNEYKRTVEKKKNIHGEYTDTDFSESEALSSLQTSGAQQQISSKTAVVSQSETEDASEHQVIRIETKQAPVPSQPEVVLSDAQEKQSTNPINKPSVKIIQENTADEEEDVALSMFSGLDGSYCPQFTRSLFSENLLMPLKTHSKHFFSTNLKPEILPLKLEKLSSELFPANLYPECLTSQTVRHSENKSQANEPYKKIFRNYIKPYRTYSHFGYNYTNYENTPKHYHIPTLSKKYIPVKKPLSYNEIFSSPRYIDLCDMCFEKVVCIRSDFFYRRVSNSENHLRESLSYMSLNYGCTGNEREKNEYYFQDAPKKWVDINRVLEPVQEVDEGDHAQTSISMIDFKPNVVAVVESSNFWDKITRMNYSEESTNSSFQPSKTITSEISVENNIDNLTNTISILSIQTPTEEQFDSQAEKPLFDERILYSNSSAEMESNNSENSTRKLMNREERNQRKHEFSELWEDHIQFYSPRRISNSETKKKKQCEVIGKTFVSNLANSNYEQLLSKKTTTHNIDKLPTVDQALIRFNTSDFNSYLDTETLLSDSELTSIELKIIEKIEVNDLKKQKIFESIHKNICHKMTPSKLEKIIVTQQEEISSNITASTPEHLSLPKINNFYSLNLSEIEKKAFEENSEDNRHKSQSLNNGSRQLKRRLGHLSPFRNISSGDKEYLISTSSSIDHSHSEHVPQTPKKPSKLREQSLSVDCDECQAARKRAKRNFIAENIRNASIPRRKNVTASLKKSLEASASSPQLLSQKAHPPVYSFQTKMVGESPTFWVTLSPMEKNNLSRSLKSKRANSQTRIHEMDGRLKSENESVLPKRKNTELFQSETIVDKGISALSQQIEAFKPRFDQYGKTLNHFGKQVSKTSGLIDAVIETQTEIKESGHQLREDIIWNQYGEKLSCNAQTFSIFEAED